MTDSELLAIRQVCEQAREASFSLASTSRAVKDAALRTIADALEANAATIVTANATDLDRARADGTSDALIDRLTITPDRLKAIADALREVAELPDPIGEVIRGYTLPNGLQIRQLRVPLGVVGMIYEARPNVTVDAAGLCLKSGNAALLRGSSSAYETNVALVAVMQDGLEAAGLPRHAIQLVPGTSHESVKHLMQARGLVDVLIPRGGAGLIKSVVEGSLVPVIETGVGNCHVYVDADADIDKAINILINSKTQRVSVCIHGDAVMANFCSEVGIDFAPATEDDWFAEYYSLDLAAGVVKSIDEAISHIRRYTSGHTEAIVSDSVTATQYFVAQVDSAAVMVNASTRFTDGGEFGFGAEIGISTQKLHARGPMGLAELTSTKFVVTGDGHIRG